MKGSRWEEVQRLCHAALERDPGERDSFLRDACAGDDAMRHDVESLLAYETHAPGFMATPAVAVAALAMTAGGSADVALQIEGYEVLSLLGAGGMGEVYRARDLKLGREVAIKVLPAFLSADPERLARFAREARVLATLNHPHIGAIYGLEDGHHGTPALVLELVEGETLAERIARGPIPVDEALPIARQMAEALEAAHDKGVIHRDLKPANVKITPGGLIKVLDFGLAKAGNSTLPDPPDAPTITMGATREGTVLGTAAYMSPEQARGLQVDKRADIWAFGCVLYEMLTGRVPFRGETMADTLAAILDRDPEWGTLSDRVPPHVQRLLRRCLQKDPRRRLHDIADARLDLDDAESARGEATVTPPRSVRATARLALSVALLSVLLAIAIGIGATTYFRRGPEPPQVYRSSLLPPDGVNWSSAIPAIRFVLSPDGRRLAFVATGADGRVLLWVRPLDALVAQPLAGTEGATMPFWSADSRMVGFNAGGKLKTINASGGPPITLADVNQNNNAAWNRDDVIVFVPQGPGPLFRISASGGAVSPLTTLDAESGDTQHWNPFFLPDGRHFLYFAVGSKTGGPVDARAVYVGSLNPSEKSRLLLQGGSNAKYAQGYLLFMRDRTLMAQRFDPDRLELAGEAVPIAEGLEVGGTTGRTGAFSVSETGVLAYQAQPGSTGLRSQLIWFDREGKVIARLDEPVEYQDITLSPDGTRAAVSLIDSAKRARDIWLFDVARGSRTRLTFDPFDELSSIWSPGGDRVLFASSRSRPFELFQTASSGAGTETEVLADGLANKFPMSWSPDGRFVLYIHDIHATSSYSLRVLPLVGDRRPFEVRQALGEVQAAQFSPDGRWIAYASNESGRNEIYVVPFSPTGSAAGASSAPGPGGGKWQVSTSGGNWPRWQHDGTELFYVAPNDRLMAVTVNGRNAEFETGTVQPLFVTRPRAQQGLNATYNYDVSPDGQRFLVNTLVDQAPPAPITLVFNWTATLKK